MDVKEIIFNELRNRGCSITMAEEDYGMKREQHVYVETPAGDVWEFTTPLRVVNKSQIKTRE